MPLHIAIIGSGPIGLEAALYARTLNHTVTVYDHGDIAANVLSWNFVRLFTPWPMNTTPLGRATLSKEFPASIHPTGTQLRDEYLLPLAASALLRDSMRPHHRIITIGRADYHKADAIGKPARGQSPFRLLLTDPDGRERFDTADIVLDCSGTYGHHRFAGRGGIPALGERAAANRLHYILPDILHRDRDRFANRHSLLLGCGFSAATVLRDFAELHRTAPQTRVTWATRRDGQALHAIANDPIPGRRDLIDATLSFTQSPPPWLTLLKGAALEAIAPSPVGSALRTTLSGSKVTAAVFSGSQEAVRSADPPADGGPLALHFTTPDGPRQIIADECIPLVGYSPDASLYDQLQIHQCYATHGPIKLAAALLGATTGNDCLIAGSALSPDTLKNPEPHFYLLGAKSYGTNSNFLLQTGHQQIRDVFQIIQQDAALDLYKME
jgi:hypothetical protein